MAVAVSGDIEDCTCQNTKTYRQYEREEFNKEVEALRKEIKDLEEENFELNETIKKITKNKEHERIYKFTCSVESQR